MRAALTRALPGLAPLVLVLVLSAGPAWGGAERRPTKAEIENQTRTAVLLSRARLVRLRVVAPNRLYSLTVKVADPAAYLKHRADALITVMNRLTNVPWRFQSRYFAVLDRSGRRILWVRHLRSGSSETWRWDVRPNLEACARDLALGVEIDPENAALPCPAP
jgi:hypothetical protein